MANKSVNSFIIFVLAIFVVFSVTAILTNLDFNGFGDEVKISWESQDSIMIEATNDMASIETEFTPNPVIEGIVLLNHRGEEYQVEIGQPMADSVFTLQEGKVELPFSGKFPKSSKELNFRIKLYSNDEAAFNNEEAVFVQEVETVIDEENKSVFNQSLEVLLEPGLYYYILETIEEEQLIAGGRFKVVR